MSFYALNMLIGHRLSFHGSFDTPGRANTAKAIRAEGEDRTRRVKCDEAKPSCQKCRSSGRKCDGYEPSSLRSAYSGDPPGEVAISLAFDVPSDALERRTYDFFRTKTAPYMAGYFRDGLWERLVLQASHSEPAIRYALTALGAQHEENLLRDRTIANGTTDVASRFPLKQYGKALQELQKQMSADAVSMNVVLICTLLLINYEALRENFRGAVIHAEHAIQLVQARSTSSRQVIEPNVVQALARIDIQGAMYLGWRVPGLLYVNDTPSAALPSSFHDLTEARDVIYTWTSRLWHFTRTVANHYKFIEPGNVPLEVFAKVQDLTNIFIRLDELLWALMHAPDAALNLRESHGMHMLRCRVKVDRIISACCLFSEITVHDRYLDIFEDIILLCSYVISCDSPEARMFTVSLDDGLLHPLWFIVTHCREGRIRHQALRLLEKLAPDKAAFHVTAMTRIAKATIRYEEGSLENDSLRCEDIPEWRRVHGAGLFSPENASHNNAVLRLRTRPNGMDGEWEDTDEILDW